MSALYTGTVRHRRFAPKAHGFTYPVFMALLDLDRLRESMAVSRLLGFNRFAWAGYDDRDHLGDPSRPLKERFRADAEAQGFAFPEGRVFLLANLRFWGYCFNPVSYVYAYDANGRLALIGAEVCNTPWKERIVYWMPVPEDDRCSSSSPVPVHQDRKPSKTNLHLGGSPGAAIRSRSLSLSSLSSLLNILLKRDRTRMQGMQGMKGMVHRLEPVVSGPTSARTDAPGVSPLAEGSVERRSLPKGWSFDVTKAMHVSPFMPMDLRYRWSFTDPGEALKVRMALFQGPERVFDADLDLERRDWTPAAIRRTVLAFPFHTLKVIAAIHYEALKLWLKRVPIFTHPAKA